ncbi:phage portal protein [Actinoallomurus spadix]|uniref:Phage portal protein n=1 Tax=Actinoallomurus spadix TaxID=79912 RepID=A0ABN0WVH4_9ACTN|nr:phage portal protein [Actinoallomurus spadix]MCO5986565.1 phage portal protein [Actinoallomurus spadix]
MRWWPFGRRTERRTIAWQDVWGSGADAEHLRGDSMNVALSLVPVYAATRLIADSVASLPLETYRRAGDTRTRITDPALIADPTAFGTTFDWVHRAVTSLALRGNAYGLVTSTDRSGTPSRIEWLHPDEVSIEQDDTAYAPRWYWRGRLLESAAFVHIPGFTLPGKVKGLSPIAAYKNAVEIGLYAQRFGRDWFVNGSTPAAVLETTEEVTQDQAKVIKDRFKNAAKGREPVALGLGVTYKPISVPAEESQFLATIRATKTDIANIYGIPPELIGGETGSSMTYANVEQQKIMLVTYALRSYLTKIETAVSRLLPRPQYVRFNADAVLRADTKTRYEAHHLALTDGWKSKDEVRAEEDLPPLPNGEGTKYAPILPTQPARVPPAGGTQ